MKTLSLVIPVYNSVDLAMSAARNLPELAEVAAGCGFRLLEAIFVDDGSSPPLQDIAADGVGCRILRMDVNSGKGAAVRAGALAAVGQWVLMSDVDLSSPFSEFAVLAEKSDAWMVCGSRRGRPGMPFMRKLLSRMFHALAWLAGSRGVSDTQCGFKLFRMDVMRRVFEMQRIARFAFDVELLVLTRRIGGTVAEVPVRWHGGRRSSLRVWRDAPRMVIDLVRIRIGRGPSCCSGRANADR